jgi:membrane protein DedA with SNARE-associated domain
MSLIAVELRTLPQMISHLIDQLSGWIIWIISLTGYGGIVLLMTIESACVPLPSEIIMPFAGYLTTKGELSIWLVALAGAVGCNIGSTIAYLAGAWGGRRAVLRWGRYLLLTEDDIDRAEWFFRWFGVRAVFVARLLPLVRTFIALPAGFSRMPMVRFQVYTFLGSLIWCFALAQLGRILGAQWDHNASFQTAFHAADLVVAVGFLAGLAWFVWTRLRRQRAH